MAFEKYKPRGLFSEFYGILYIYIYIYINSLNYSKKNTLYLQFAQIVHPQLPVNIGDTDKLKISK